MSCRDLTTQQGTKIVAPAMTNRLHAIFRIVTFLACGLMNNKTEMKNTHVEYTCLLGIVCKALIILKKHENKLDVRHIRHTKYLPPSPPSHHHFTITVIMTITADLWIYSTKGQLCGALIFPFQLAWMSSWTNSWFAGDLKHHHAHATSKNTCTRMYLPRMFGWSLCRTLQQTRPPQTRWWGTI